MKSLKMTAVIAALVACIPLTAHSEGITKSGSIDLLVDNYGIFQSAVGHSWSRALELGNEAKWYKIDYSGGVSLSSDAGTATVMGLCGADPGSKTYTPGSAGSLWSFNYSVDGTNWKSAGAVINTASVPAFTTTKTFSDAGSNSAVFAKYIQIEYFGALTSNYDASAGGSGTMTATLTSVPEPGSIIVLLTAMGPVGVMVRRKMHR